MDYVIALVMGWAFERAAMIISSPNYSSPFNGFGAIDLILSGKAKAPMAYRVLVPAICGMVERLGVERIAIYQALKILLNAAAFFLVSLVFGMPAAMLTAILLLLTVKYDYWDWQAEMIGVMAGLSGNLPLAIFGGAIHGLSKETAPLTPFAYLIATGDGLGTVLVGGATLLAMALPRLIYGRKPLYCERFQMKYNMGLFKGFADPGMWKWGQWFHTDIFIACLMIAGTIAAQLSRPNLDGIIPAAILAAGWTMAKADETRVFALCLPWIAKMLVGG